MSTERDYQKLYDRLLEEVGALHRANQHRIPKETGAPVQKVNPLKASKRQARG